MPFKSRWPAKQALNSVCVTVNKPTSINVMHEGICRHAVYTRAYLKNLMHALVERYKTAGNHAINEAVITALAIKGFCILTCLQKKKEKKSIYLLLHVVYSLLNLANEAQYSPLYFVGEHYLTTTRIPYVAIT